MEPEGEAEESGGLTYEEAKDICLAYLVLINKLRGKEWVPSFVGRSDVYIVNKVGGLIQKNRRNGADLYCDGDGAKYSMLTSCTTTILNFDLSAKSSGAS